MSGTKKKGSPDLRRKGNQFLFCSPRAVVFLTFRVVLHGPRLLWWIVTGSIERPLLEELEAVFSGQQSVNNLCLYQTRLLSNLGACLYLAVYPVFCRLIKFWVSDKNGSLQGDAPLRVHALSSRIKAHRRKKSNNNNNNNNRQK